MCCTLTIFFSSYKILKELSEIGVRATGTIRNNRMNNCPLSKDDVKKSERGTFDYKSDGDVFLICVQKDSNVVTIISNFDTVLPTNSFSRYYVAKKKKVSISQPNLIENYNLHMGGADMTINYNTFVILTDHIRGKKWQWNLFKNAVNTLATAS